MATGAWHHTASVQSVLVNLARIVNGLGSKDPVKLIDGIDCHPYLQRSRLQKLNEELVGELARIKTLPLDERKAARDKLHAKYAEERSRLNVARDSSRESGNTAVHSQPDTAGVAEGAA